MVSINDLFDFSRLRTPEEKLADAAAAEAEAAARPNRYVAARWREEPVELDAEAEPEAEAEPDAETEIKAEAGAQATVGRSKIAPFHELLGTVDDRVVARKAGVTLSAVRAYRYKRGIELKPDVLTAILAARTSKSAATRKQNTARREELVEPAVRRAQQQPPGQGPRQRATSSAARWAYEVTITLDEGSETYLVVATDVASAGAQALDGLRRRGIVGVVRSLELINEAL